MILHDYWRSSAAFRVRIALALKGIEPGRRYVHLRKGEQRAPGHLAKHPLGLVPVLEDGATTLTQSLAILEYLEETHPKPPLLPAKPAERAWVRAVALAVACEIHPLNNLRVLRYLERELRADEAARDRWYAHWVAEGLGAIEKMLAERPGPGPFCLGATPTIADACLVPQVFNAWRFKVPVEPYPLVGAVVEACLALPAFDASRPERQPDAEP
ncbi:MAG: maleylacetoacetate isomerase [Burkholderiales bacterium]|nr:maleylacetoacetate isomerase [Burkholderiales bacterium]MCL4689622.1 maleylacetoacetate isomerase [Burkholderiales bacterium]